MPDALDPTTLAILSGNPDALQTMRQYALAQQLQEMSLGGARQPEQLGLGGKYPHAARVGPLSAAAPLVEALMARKGFETSGPAMTKLLGGAYGIPQQGTPQGQPSPPASGQPLPGSPPGGPNAPPPGPNPYAPVTQQDIAGTQVPGVSPIVQMQSRTSLEGAQKYREMQLAAQKQQHAGTVSQLDNLIKSDKPSQYVQQDQNFQTMWPSLARQMGVDPQSGYNDQNVRRALGMIRNPLAASVGIPEEAIPEQMRQESGPFGQSFDVNPVTLERKQVSGREMPTKVGEKYDPNTDTNIAVYKNWFPSSGAAPAGASPGAPSAPAGGQGAAPGITQVPVGLPAPSADQTRAAGVAMSMRTGLEKVRQLEQQGFNLSPSDRAAIIGVISEQGGPLGVITGGALASLPLQELLAHKLTPQGQTYLSALMPVLQGIGHHLGGQRLNDVQIKSLMESIAPIDTHNKEAMAQINSNRTGYYSGLLGEAGPARNLPVFGGRLKADYESIGNANTPILKGGGVPANIQRLLDKYPPKNTNGP